MRLQAAAPAAQRRQQRRAAGADSSRCRVRADRDWRRVIGGNGGHAGSRIVGSRDDDARGGHDVAGAARLALVMKL